jgi:phage shock protein E
MRPFLFAATLVFSLPALSAEVDQHSALQALEQPGAVLIDVRSDAEHAAGALPDARHIVHSRIAAQIADVAPDKDSPIVLYCRSGSRSSSAQDTLTGLGYRQVFNAGGYDDLKTVLDSRE